MTEQEKRQEILQAGINYITHHIEDKENIIKNHPKDDKEFIDSQERQKAVWQDLYDYAVEWRNSLNK